MKTTSEFRDGALRLALSGELDHHSARAVIAELSELIETRLPSRLTIDMRGVTFMDSSGIAVILGAYKRVNAFGGRLEVRNISAHAGKILSAAGVDRIVDLGSGA